MTARRLLLIGGAVMLVAGIIALLVPVSASGNSGSVGCGNAVASDLSAAREKDNNLGNAAADTASNFGLPGVASQIPQTRYVEACNSALSTRRAWSIPLAVVGLLLAGGSFLVRGRTAR